MHQKQIMRAIEAGDADMLRSLIARLPATSFNPQALEALASPKLEMRLAGLNFAAARLAQGLAVDLARPLAEAIYAVALAHLDDPELIPGAFATAAWTAADSLAEALTLIGAYENIVALARAAPVDLRARMNSDYETSLRLKAAKALIQLGRLQEAELELNALKAEGAETHPSFSFVRDWLDERLQSATLLAKRLTTDKKAIASGSVALPENATIGRRYVRNIITTCCGSSKLMQRIFASYKETKLRILEVFGSIRRRAQRDSDPAIPLSERLDRNPDMRSKLAGKLGLDRSEFWQWRDRKSKAQAILVDPAAGHDPARLADSLRTLLKAQAWFEANGHREESRGTLWSIYLCQKRLGRAEKALAVLRDLAARIEAERARITDPMRRAGIAAASPYLYPSLAELCAARDDPQGLLAAIEAAKGRTLADLLTHRDGAAADEAGLRLEPAEAEELTQALSIHYLSLLVDEGASYAVLVTKTGRWHWQQVPLGRDTIAKLVAPIDAPRWGTKNKFGEVRDPCRILAPLLAWLEPLLEAREIVRDDHLVYSADEHLHQFPLHVLELGGEPLATYLGVTRVHGLATLRRIAQRPARRPKRALALFVPAADRVTPAEIEREAAAFNATAVALAGLLPTTVPDGRSVDPGYVAGLRAPEALVHLTGHGRFPEESIEKGIGPNPYNSAGILLAEAGELPVRRASWSACLTPKLVLENPALDLNEAHVTLEGCVSGLAKEGIGGDALGVEWAVLAKGAASVLATHWHVNFASAAAFSRLFYQEWLGEKRSRVEAWRRAVLALRSHPQFGRSLVDWGAFSLTGDWR